jgi:hypothetical protein
MQRAKQLAAATTVIAVLAATTAWLFRTPQTHAVLLPPVPGLVR